MSEQDARGYVGLPIITLAILVVLSFSAQGEDSGQAANIGLSDDMPPGVSTGESDIGRVYVNAEGMTLYSLSAYWAEWRARTVLNYCVGSCAKTWTPLSASSSDKPVGEWTIEEGARGLQWVYKGDPVFTFNDDRVPGSALGHDEDEGLWKALTYISPEPEFIAPPQVAVNYRDGQYILTDSNGGVLLKGGELGACGTSCADVQPFLAGMAVKSIGDWAVTNSGDRAQWTYEGEPIFVGQSFERSQVPHGAIVLQQNGVLK